MSKAFSSKKPSLPPPPTATTATSCAKKKRSPRSPLQDLNRISNSSNSSYASSVSTEAPKGCLRFLSSSSFKTPVHRTRNLSKTPISAPNALALKQSRSKSSKENLSKGNNTEQQTRRVTSDKVRSFRKNPPRLYQWQSGKKSGSRTGQKSKPGSVLNGHGKFLPGLPPACEELKQQKDSLGVTNENAGEHSQLGLCHNDTYLTPLSPKATESDLDVTIDGDDRSISRTPPIEDSFSPEIQCGSSLVSMKTPACYGAGYVVSGVTDKRKCRPRGILTVEEKDSGFDIKAAYSFDEDEKKTPNVDDYADPSLLPSPTEALVHWLSSPHNKGKKDLSWKSENGLNQSHGLAESTALGSSPPPSSSHKTCSNISDSSDLSGAGNSIKNRMSTSISQIGLPEFQVPFDSVQSPSYTPRFFSPNSRPSCWERSTEKGKNYRYNLIDENSPFSMNSLSSGNVIQTPQSDSSSDLHVVLSWANASGRKEDNSNSLGEVLLSENFCLNSSVPLEDSVNSSFQFDCSTLPYESIDLSKLPKFLHGPDLWSSSSTLENASQSRMRISWREGFMSQLYELDDFDSCRCLSDEEDLPNYYGINKLSIPDGPPQVNVEVDDHKTLNSDVRITEADHNEPAIDALGKEMFSASISCSGAESISSVGGGLALGASTDDSDWSLCYNNGVI